jgi:hypothetical protein
MEGAHGRGEGAHDDVKKDMDEDQLMWWNETKADIMERRRQLRGESFTLRGESLMSGCGDGGVDNFTGA